MATCGFCAGLGEPGAANRRCKSEDEVYGFWCVRRDRHPSPHVACTSGTCDHHRWWPGRSEHQLRVEEVMAYAEEEVPDRPEIPDAGVRKARARSILEGALDAVEALGISIRVLDPESNRSYPMLDWILVVDPNQEMGLPSVVGYCCRLQSEVTRTLSAFGVSDLEPQRRVDESVCKLVRSVKEKRLVWDTPDIVSALNQQGWEEPRPSDEEGWEPGVADV